MPNANAVGGSGRRKAQPPGCSPALSAAGSLPQARSIPAQPEEAQRLADQCVRSAGAVRRKGSGGWPRRPGNAPGGSESSSSRRRWPAEAGVAPAPIRTRWEDPISWRTWWCSAAPPVSSSFSIAAFLEDLRVRRRTRCFFQFFAGCFSGESHGSTSYRGIPLVFRLPPRWLAAAGVDGQQRLADWRDRQGIARLSSAGLGSGGGECN